VADIQAIADTVNAAADLIRGLEQHSQEISNVVSVIKEVADQTNLLALNAAIEAARAGEQGRGFAVVADEVRKLAERTSSSTQEIANTIVTMRNSAGDAVASIETVVEKVNQGVITAQEANNAIRQIGESSRAAVAMVEEITSAIREQGSATNNIAIQVEKIAQMSEESSAAAGHSADAAKDLDRLATGMQQIVSTYKL
jgi:methyl-accepting chemotaxis protein